MNTEFPWRLRFKQVHTYMNNKVKILILEHDSNDLDLINYQLYKMGLLYESCVVETESDFEQSIREFSPDIILSDFSLPLYDGALAFEFSQKIVPNIPFVFVSGEINEENSIEFLKRGLTDFVPKDKLFTLPFSIIRALGDKFQMA